MNIAENVPQAKGESVTSEALQQELAKIKTHNGIAGTVTFDESGNAHRKLFVKIIKDGTLSHTRDN